MISKNELTSDIVLSYIHSRSFCILKALACTVYLLMQYKMNSMHSVGVFVSAWLLVGVEFSYMCLW